MARDVHQLKASLAVQSHDEIFGLWQYNHHTRRRERRIAAVPADVRAMETSCPLVTAPSPFVAL
jgi:hypothetical protein